MRTYHLKTRLTAEENRALQRAADATGLTVSEYVRTVLARDREAVTVDTVLARIESRLAEPVTPSPQPAPAMPPNLEPLLVEVLLLVRELAADRNAQLLARVAQQLNARFPQRNKS